MVPPAVLVGPLGSRGNFIKFGLDALASAEQKETVVQWLPFRAVAGSYLLRSQ